MLIFDDDVSNLVLATPTRSISRVLPISGVMIHSTRSGHWQPQELEYEGTMNWSHHPQNIVRESSGLVYHAQWNITVGGGRKGLCVPVNRVPRWSAGAHDPWLISIEVCQSMPTQSYLDIDIESTYEIVKHYGNQYGFPLIRIPFLDGNNSQLPGIASHEDSANGKKWGKSDPSPLFWKSWDRFIADKDGDMEAEEWIKEHEASYTLTRAQLLQARRVLVRKVKDREGEFIFDDAALNHLDTLGVGLYDYIEKLNSEVTVLKQRLTELEQSDKKGNSITEGNYRIISGQLELE